MPCSNQLSYVAKKRFGTRILNPPPHGVNRTGLDVEAEVDHIAVLHRIVLTLKTPLAGVLGPLLAAVGHKVFEANDLGPNEAALKIGMDTPAAASGAVAGLRTVQARTSFSPAVKKVSKSQAVAAADHAIQPRLLEPQISEERFRIFVIKLRDLGFQLGAEGDNHGPSSAALASTAARAGEPLDSPSSSTLARIITGFAVRRNNNLKRALRASSASASTTRAGVPASEGPQNLLQEIRFSLRFLVPHLGARDTRARAFSTVSRSARSSSVLITSMSAPGSTRPSTWITFSSSKQRTTWAMASVSLMLAEELVPQPFALRSSSH